MKYEDIVARMKQLTQRISSMPDECPSDVSELCELVHKLPKRRPYKRSAAQKAKDAARKQMKRDKAREEPKRTTALEKMRIEIERLEKEAQQ